MNRGHVYIYLNFPPPIRHRYRVSYICYYVHTRVYMYIYMCTIHILCRALNHAMLPAPFQVRDYGSHNGFFPKPSRTIDCLVDPLHIRRTRECGPKTGIRDVVLFCFFVFFFRSAAINNPKLTTRHAH